MPEVAQCLVAQFIFFPPALSRCAYAYKDSPYTAHHNHNEEPHMQIRIRKHTLSLIRNDYDPALKRGRSTYLGGMPIDSLGIPPQIDAKLRVQERNQLLSELKKLHSAREIEMEELAGRLLPINLRRAIRWYDRQESSDELSSLAKECREIWTELLAAMVRAGVGRTRQRTKRGALKSTQG